MIKAVDSLSYLFKELDPDGIDVTSTTAPDKRSRCSTSTKVTGVVGTAFRDGREADCHIERALSVILKSVRENWPPTIRSARTSVIGTAFRPPPLRPISIYIFTNGRWDNSEDGACGAVLPIKTMIDKMKERDVGRTDVSLQFVRFGSDDRGIARLRILDDEVPGDLYETMLL